MNAEVFHDEDRFLDGGLVDELASTDLAGNALHDPKTMQPKARNLYQWTLKQQSADAVVSGAFNVGTAILISSRNCLFCFRWTKKRAPFAPFLS